MVKSLCGVALSLLLLLFAFGCSDGDGDTETSTLHISPATMPVGVVGAFYSQTIEVTGERTPVGDISISEGALPPGLDLQFSPVTRNAVISGTPTMAGTYSFTVYAWCYGTNVSGQTAERRYTIVVTE